MNWRVLFLCGIQLLYVCQLYAQPREYPETTFGTKERMDNALIGKIYHLPKGTGALPDFSQLSPVGTIFTQEINAPPRSFNLGFPGITDRFEWFAVRFEGDFRIKRSGNYTFRVYSDDGAKLFINGQLVVNNDGVHPPRSRSGTINLDVGKSHTIVVEYFQGPRYDIALQVFVKFQDGTEGIFPSNIATVSDPPVMIRFVALNADTQTYEPILGEAKLHSTLYVEVIYEEDQREAQKEVKLDWGTDESTNINVTRIDARLYRSNKIHLRPRRSQIIDLEEPQ